MGECTKTKDVLMIVKGHVSEKFKVKDGIIEALREYQANRTCTELKYILDGDVLSYALIPAADEFFKKHHWKQIITQYMMKDIDFATGGLDTRRFPDGNVILTHKYLCEVIISSLSLLDVLDNSGNCIIDLSAYEDDKIII